MKTVTCTASKMSVILYQCVKCGQRDLYKMTITAQASGNYHALQSQLKKRNAEAAASRTAKNLLIQRDAYIFESVNQKHNYECVSDRVICPYCGELQPWSGIPVRWTKKPLFGLWVVGVFLCVLFTLVEIIDFTLIPGITFLCADIALAALPFFAVRKRKKQIKRLESADFEHPIYYNQSNLRELIDGPYAYLLQRKPMARQTAHEA